jgi:hydroxyacyl-ACP dehydratase HTD2-like protein with hotdog domain
MGERTVVQGPITVGFMFEMLRRALPDAKLQALEVRYLANAFQGDVVRVTGTVEDVSNSQVRCVVVAEIAGENRQVAIGTAIVTR